MESVDGDGDPPPELILSWQCSRWACLPDTGGYFEQDYSIMRRMTTLANVYNALTKYRNAKGAQIHNLTESDRRILRFLKDAGLLFNG